MRKNQANVQALILSVGVVGMLSAMLLPLPAFILDVLLASNLTLALVLLISTLYIDQPVKLSALPTMLLLATLFRLALNISSTRLILSGGEASQIITAFGEVVVDGNIVLGLVLFLVVTLVQFIVIAKGAERVAEVSARFTLDALPGRQMSIDADVRAGLIDFDTASSRRAELQVESRFYGALDGAMKFIKGDALVGIIVTTINILGGLTIGILVLNLDPQTALYQFSLLSIGDGLMAQIPALLNSLAAGIVVTRVVNQNQNSLATDLLSQLQVGKVEILALGVFLLTLSLASPLPILPFLVVGVFLFASYVLRLKTGTEEPDKQSKSYLPQLTPLLELRLSSELIRSLSSPDVLLELARDIQEAVHRSTGLLIRAPRLDLCAEEHSAECSCQILVRGLPVKSVQQLNTDQLSKTLGQIVTELVWSRSEEFIDDIMVRAMLDEFDNFAPELVAHVIPGMLSVTQLTMILKMLIDEGVAVSHFDVILQALAENAAHKNNERELLIEVRKALGRQICHQQLMQTGSEKLCAASLQAELDLLLARVECENIELHPTILDTIDQAIASTRPQVVVVSAAARRILAEILRQQKHTIPVLAFQEIAPEICIEISQTIMLDGITEAFLQEELVA